LEQRGHRVVGDEALRDHTALAPFADRQPLTVAHVDPRAHRRNHLGLDRGTIDAVRGVGAHAPGLALAPAGVAEIVGDRVQRVGLAGPDVAIAVPVAVYREPQVHAWQELRVAERAGP